MRIMDWETSGKRISWVEDRKMVKVLIYVEGQTEERFINDIIVPHLAGFGIVIIPKIATTKVVKSGPNFKGGIGKYTKTKKEMQNLLGDSSADMVTTMLDYYGLPIDYPGRNIPVGTTSYSRVQHVEQEIASDINNSRFLPYLTLHDFEGLLFTSPQAMADTLIGGTNLLEPFTKIKDLFNTPEEINDNPNTAPNKRIQKLYPNYQKVLHGSVIAANIGLDNIRSACPHFTEWLTKLEALA